MTATTKRQADPRQNGTGDELAERAEIQRRGVALDDFRDDDDEPTDAHSYARRKLKLPDLARLVKRGSSNALYDLELDDGTLIPIGNSADLMNPRKVEAAIADRTGAAIPYYGPKQFRRIAAALLSIAEVEESGSTERDETGAWLGSFVDGQLGARRVPMGEPDRLASLLHGREPVMLGDDGRLYLHLDALVRHITHAVGQRTTRRDLAARLTRLGFRPKQLSARDPERGGEIVKRRYFASPVGFNAHEES